MEYAHILMAILAAWRIVELVLYDTLFLPVRKRFPQMATCVRCAPFWVSIVTVAALIYLPWLNWPFGISMLYIAWTELKRILQFNHWRKIVIYPDLQKMDKGEYDHSFVINTLKSIVDSSDRVVNKEH